MLFDEALIFEPDGGMIPSSMRVMMQGQANVAMMDDDEAACPGWIDALVTAATVSGP